MEELKDIRIYYYDGAGKLIKEGRLKNTHKHPSITAAKEYLSRRAEKRKMRAQYILVEYTDVYESKIIEIVDYGRSISGDKDS